MLESILTILASTAFGAIAGYLVAGKQDRDRNRRRLQGVAGALWADLKRIREELGPPRERITELRMFGSDPIPPGIHDWTKGLIPELADLNPDLVLRFFQLERALHNHGVALRAYRSALDAVGKRRDQLQEVSKKKEEADDNHEGDPSWVDLWRREDDLRNEIAALEDQRDMWHDAAVDDRKRATSLMEAIEGGLRAALPAGEGVELVPARPETARGGVKQVSAGSDG